MTPRVEIRPRRPFSVHDARELWDHRELIWFLAWRDVRVRYKQTTLGAFWAVLQPLALMAVFAIFLGRLAKVPSDGVSYPLFVLAGLVPWTCASQSVDAGAFSVVGNSQLVSKTYFPRLALPLAALGAPLIDLLVAAVLFLAVAAISGEIPGARVLLAPLFLLLAIVAALSVAIWLAALNVRFRDVRFVIRLGLQLWLFLTPVAYSATLVPDEWKTVYGLNPLAGPVAAFRWATIGAGDTPGSTLLTSLVVSLVLLITGIAYFRRTERTFADVI